MDFSIAWIEAAEIDAIGMARAGRKVFHLAVDSLRVKPDHILIDYFAVPKLNTPQTSLTKGDQRSLSIACASVLAKQARDARMMDLAGDYPGYFIAENKGYGSQNHIKAIQNLGLTDIHRKSFCEGLFFSAFAVLIWIYRRENERRNPTNFKTWPPGTQSL